MNSIKYSIAVVDYFIIESLETLLMQNFILHQIESATEGFVDPFLIQSQNNLCATLPASFWRHFLSIISREGFLFLRRNLVCAEWVGQYNHLAKTSHIVPLHWGLLSVRGASGKHSCNITGKRAKKCSWQPIEVVFFLNIELYLLFFSRATVQCPFPCSKEPFCFVVYSGQVCAIPVLWHHVWFWSELIPPTVNLTGKAGGRSPEDIYFLPWPLLTLSLLLSPTLTEWKSKQNWYEATNLTWVPTRMHRCEFKRKCVGFRPSGVGSVPVFNIWQRAD